MVSFGSNVNEGFSVPLFFDGRYFVVEPGNPPLITVIVDKGEGPIFEVTRNKPAVNPLTKVSSTPPGFITVSDIDSGRFLYKVRPKNEISIALGRLDGEETAVVIRDYAIFVDSNRIAENRSSERIGLRVNLDGSFIVGGQLPPEVREWMASI